MREDKTEDWKISWHYIPLIMTHGCWVIVQVIVLERNRRIAKAYARAPVLTVNGSEDGFDGFRWDEKEGGNAFIC